MPRRHARSSSTGGGRPRLPVYRPPRPAPFEPHPAVLALLRSTWAQRDRLTTTSRDIVRSFLQQARTRALSDRQLDVAAKIGASVQVGFDDPRLDDPAPTKAPRVQPWGPLPLKPPGR